MASGLMQITSPYFVAGVVIDGGGKVFQTADILSYMIGWSVHRVLTYSQKKGWTVVWVRKASVRRGVPAGW